MSDAAPSNLIILYGRPGCPMTPPVRRMMTRAKVAFEYIDIWADAAARERVMAINGGNESVPTVVFPDGRTLTEPPSNVLKKRLEAMGYVVPPPVWLQTIRRLLKRT